jgi:hypothetical protein
MHSIYPSWNGFLPTLWCNPYSEMCLCIVNYKTWYHTWANFEVLHWNLVPVYLCFTLYIQHHNHDLTNSQCPVCQAWRSFIWLACGFGPAHGMTVFCPLCQQSPCVDFNLQWWQVFELALSFITKCPPADVLSIFMNTHIFCLHFQSTAVRLLLTLSCIDFSAILPKPSNIPLWFCIELF